MSLELLLSASIQTVYMVLAAGFMASIIGIPLGIVLFISRNEQLLSKKALYHTLALVVNTMRSIPFIVMLVAVIPLTRLIVGSSIGTTAALVPLSLAAIPFLARLIEGVLLEIPQGLIEAARSMGATNLQIVRRVLLPEALSGVLNSITLTLVNLVGYSAMAGVVGGGGLGDLAIRFGYQRFDVKVMLSTIIILIIMVQLIQFIGEKVASIARHDS